MTAVLERIARALEERPLAERSSPFTLGEIAERWGNCSVESVERMVRAGELRAFKPVKAWLVRPADLAKYERDRSEKR